MQKRKKKRREKPESKWTRLLNKKLEKKYISEESPRKETLQMQTFI